MSGGFSVRKTEYEKINFKDLGYMQHSISTRINF